MKELLSYPSITLRETDLENMSLMICEILGVCGETLTAKQKYPV